MGPWSYDESRVFPTQTSTFLGEEVQIPNDVEHVLERTYGPSVFRVCQGNDRDHRKMVRIPVAEVECRQLRHIFNFPKMEEEGGRKLYDGFGTE